MKLQMLKLDLEKAEEPEIKLPITTGLSKKQESFRKTSTSASLIMLKTLDCVDHNTLWKILKDTRIPDHLTCLLHVGQEAAVRTLHGTTDWFKRGKGVGHRCILLTCLFNFYPDYIVQNAGLDESLLELRLLTKI